MDESSNGWTRLVTGLSLSTETPGSKDPSTGVPSPRREETLSGRLAGTTIPNGPAGTALSIASTNATSDPSHPCFIRRLHYQGALPSDPSAELLSVKPISLLGKVLNRR